MTTQNKSKAEQGFIDAFDRVQGDLPGGEAVGAARKQALEHFAEQGLPHRRIEEWKYTDLRQRVKDALPLAVSDGTDVAWADLAEALGPFAELDAHRFVLVNGRYREGLSTVGPLGGFTISPLSALVDRGDADERVSAFTIDGGDDNAVLALNTAYSTDGAVVQVEAGAAPDKPILLVHARAGDAAQFSAVRHLIDVAEGATATIIEAFVRLPDAAESGQVNAATRVTAADDATVHHVKFVSEAHATTHLSNLIARLGARTVYRPFQHTQAVGLARNQALITFDGEDATLDLSGAFLGSGDDHIDTTLVVNHDVPGCESRELFKGVLADRARGVFQGKVVVQPIAQKTDGKQMAQALMLSPDTEFDSKPELEIYADDVACGHGSTVAEIDEDMLFYCKSRGIPEATARVLLTESFIAEAIEQVEVEAVQEALMTAARGWLEHVSRD